MSTSPQWLAKKHIDWEAVQISLQESQTKNQFTNGGPCVKTLENDLTEFLCISSDKSIIAICNATCALHTLVSAYDILLGKRLRYATQAFNFPSSVQGPLSDRCQIVDIDPSTGTLNLNNINEEEVDGIIVTNPFGNVGPIDLYCKWGLENNKIVLFDNAATPFTFYSGKNVLNYGDGCIVSLHHTKPIGFGEGGFIVVDKKIEPIIRKLINFGYDMVRMDMIWLPEGSNFKISDLSAAFSLCYIRSHFTRMVNYHSYLYKMYKEKLTSTDYGITIFPNVGEQSLLSCVAILFPFPISGTTFAHLSIRKYYKPLSDDQTLCPISYNFYDKILCLPCNLDITEKMVEQICDHLIEYIKQNIQNK